jgi:hypothetical protein
MADGGAQVVAHTALSDFYDSGQVIAKPLREFSRA